MDRQDVMKRLLYPKCKSAIEFKFDTLIANPLLSYITIQDIAQLNKIATSIKYSSKPKKKYEMIDNILVPRGFKKMASGTNRVVYRFLNDYRVVLKVAIDKVGLSDNGNEYRNQQLLKPFVTKCFEASPCGTVGLFERVVPITSREEFMNISDDVFDLINNIIGKYVLEDIGEKYYMNYGLREGFGPVLLDYPYVFELDGRKLICNVADPTEPNGYCGGEIDYDLGYNDLICRKCGKRYLATELKSDEKSDNKPKIIIKGDDIIMKCVLKRGNEIINKLNSEEPASSNTIKPKNQFDRMKGRINKNPSNNGNDKRNYRPNIKSHDDIHLKAKLVGDSREKNIDKIARDKEKKSYEGVKNIPVSFAKENNQQQNTRTVRTSYELEKPTETLTAKINKPVEENKDTDYYITPDGEIYINNNGEKVLIGYKHDSAFVVGLLNKISTLEDELNKCKPEKSTKDKLMVDVDNDGIIYNENHIIGYTTESKYICSILNELDTNKAICKETEDKLKSFENAIPVKIYNGKIFNLNKEIIGYPSDGSYLRYLKKRDKKLRYYENNTEEENIKDESSIENVHESKYNEDSGHLTTSLGEIMKGKIINETEERHDTSYKTSGIVSKVENHYSNAEIENDNETEENESKDYEVPELIIHPRNNKEKYKPELHDESVLSEF